MPHCHRCAAEVAEGSRFCAACGASLAGGAGSVTTGNVSGTGIAIGTQASASVSQGVNVEDLARLLGRARTLIDEREEDPEVEKAELREAVDAIESEAAKGEQADASRIRRWLRVLAEAAPDVLAVTSAALVNPLTGVAEGVRRIAVAMQPEPEE